MQIKLYNNMSDINVIDKNLVNELLINATLKSITDFLRPSLELVTPAQNFNYFYIPSFNRYYYVDDLQVVNSRLIKIVGRVDVLKTYATDILNSHGLLTRGKDFNPYFGNFESELREESRIIEFENNFNEQGQIVMISVNGGDNPQKGA